MAHDRNSTNRTGAMVAITDRMIAGLLLLYCAPVMLIVAFLVWHESRGPVLARRVRRDGNGLAVSLWEFRTMTAQRAVCGIASPLAAQYTPFGRFLRCTGLDLLPRLFNTLRGEVAFSGLMR